MMTSDQQAQAASILADAANPEIDRNALLYRLTVFGKKFTGDAHRALQQRVYAVLGSMPSRSRPRATVLSTRRPHYSGRIFRVS
jgi:hypothetical protein